jgi:hypothetical protein
MANPVIAAWGGDAAAREALLVDCRNRPTDLTLISWCARLDRRAGAIDAAATWNSMAEVLIGGSSQFGAELRVAGPDVVTYRGGFPATFWGTFTYRRPGPADILVPELVHLTLR